ncbi:hypothetical protein CVT24_008297 [Panaeolus cyanescens]|uniref:Uncharacterized protein n=1 Tax=Panaeolus cyanescens TaxID=181874 RepID=A0A409W0M5_9AGAR|nr:hypothetical protein CVT24_008297 [Panaeolus cyanescens]
MWNKICNDQARRRAEHHFDHLCNVIWKKEIMNGAMVVKFEANQKSVIKVLEKKLQRFAMIPRGMFDTDSETKIAPILYEDLINRIEKTRQEKRFNLEELNRALKDRDLLLQSIHNSRLNEVHNLLKNYVDQVVAFEHSPDGCKVDPQQVLHRHLINQVSDAEAYVQVINDASLKYCIHERDYLDGMLQTAQDELIKASQSLRYFEVAPSFSFISFSDPVDPHPELTKMAQEGKMELRALRYNYDIHELAKGFTPSAAVTKRAMKDYADACSLFGADSWGMNADLDCCDSVSQMGLHVHKKPSFLNLVKLAFRSKADRFLATRQHDSSTSFLSSSINVVQ